MLDFNDGGVQNLDANKTFDYDDSNFKVIDYQPEPSYHNDVIKKQLPKNYKEKRKRRRNMQKKSRKNNRKK